MSRRGAAIGRFGPAKPFRLGGRVALACAASALLLVGGWTALWFFARSQAIDSFDAWLASERTHGRSWSCTDRDVSGYPLAIRLVCDRPTFQGAVADGVFRGDMSRLTAEADLYQPTRVDIDLQSPLAVTEVNGPRTFHAVWSNATLMLRGTLPADLARGWLMAENIVIGDTAPTSRVDHVELSFRPIVRQGDQRSDLDATLKVAGAQVPSADAAFGSTDPLSLTVQGIVTQVAFDGATTAPDVLGPWSHAGGQVHVDTFSVAKGSFKAEGGGRIGLDEEHRVEGRLETRFTGLEPIAARFGIPLGAVKVGGLLANLLGGKPSGGDGEQGGIALAVAAKDGHVLLGPVRTGVSLHPLY